MSFYSYRVYVLLKTLSPSLSAGIVTRVFTTLKCKQIGDKQYLVADYSVVCNVGEHAQYQAAMIFFAIVYVFGIPIGSTLVLHCNRKKLFSESESGKTFRAMFSSIYEAYEPKYWYFESIIMIQKAMLTGGLVLIAPGTSAQILVGLIIALVFYTILLRTQPYEGEEEDLLQSIATASTVMTLLIGFTLKAVQNEGGPNEQGTYDDAVLDILLVLLFTAVGLSGMFIMVRSLPCCALAKGTEEEEEEEECEQKVEIQEETLREVVLVGDERGDL